MSSSDHDRRIDYIEFSVKSVPDAKRFYGSAFGWTFEDYGPDYAGFADGRLTGGFQTAAKVRTGGPLVIIYAADLEEMEPGQAGRRHHRETDLQLSWRTPVSLCRSQRQRAGRVVRQIKSEE